MATIHPPLVHKTKSSSNLPISISMDTYSPRSSEPVVNNHNHFKRSFSINKLIGITEKPLTPRISSNSISSKIPQNTLRLLESTKTLDRLIKILKTTNVFFIENVQELHVSDPRLVIWRMEQTHRIVFKKLCELTKFSQKSIDFINTLLTQTESNDECCEQFFLTVLLEFDTIFQDEGNPHFDNEGKIISSTTDMLFSVMFDMFDNENILDLLVHTSKYFMSNLDFINQLQLKQQYLENLPKESTSYQSIRTTLEHALMGYITFIYPLSTECKEKIKEIISTELFTEEYKRAVIVAIGIENEQNCLSKSQNIRLKLSSLSLIEERRSISFFNLNLTSPPILTPPDFVNKNNKHEKKRSFNGYSEKSKKRLSDDILFMLSEKITTYSFVTLPTELISGQLVRYDAQMISQIPLNQIYLIEKSSQMKKYIDNLSRFEKFVLDLLVDKATFQLFIKVAWNCVELGDFNIAFLLFSCVSQRSMKHPSIINNMKKTKNIFEKLETLFSISKNHQNYRNAFQFESPLKRIPIISIWIHDMISQVEGDIINEGFVDVARLRKIDKFIKQLTDSQKVDHKIESVDSLTHFFDSIFL
ncbi:Ras-GEF domain-containing protein [Entamoeba marina]